MREFGAFDRQGKPITEREWSTLYADMNYKVVEQGDIGGVTVSTVWLGLDHGFGYTKRPIIFETMIFTWHLCPEDVHPAIAALEQDQWRYYTEDEARTGHEEVCRMVRHVLDAADQADEVLREVADRVTHEQ